MVIPIIPTKQPKEGYMTHDSILTAVARALFLLFLLVRDRFGRRDYMYEETAFFLTLSAMFKRAHRYKQRFRSNQKNKYQQISDIPRSGGIKLIPTRSVRKTPTSLRNRTVTGHVNGANVPPPPASHDCYQN